MKEILDRIQDSLNEIEASGGGGSGSNAYSYAGDNGLVSSGTLNQTAALDAFLNDPNVKAAQLFPGGVIKAYNVLFTPRMLLNGMQTAISPNDGIDMLAWVPVIAPDVAALGGGNVAQTQRYGYYHDLVILAANNKGAGSSRFCIGFTANAFNRLYLQRFSVNEMGIGLDFRGVNYASVKECHVVNCGIGILTRNGPDYGGGTDFWFDACSIIQINDPIESTGTGIGMLFSEEAKVTRPMGDIHVTNTHFNSCTTAHVALVSINPKRGRVVDVNLHGVGMEFINGNGAASEAQWMDLNTFFYEYNDEDTSDAYGAIVRKAIQPASIYIETGRVTATNHHQNDGLAHVIVYLDGPKAEFVSNQISAGGNTNGYVYAIRADHVDATARVDVIDFGIHQNLTEYPRQCAWGSTNRITTCSGAPISRKVTAPEYKRWLLSTISSLAPVWSAANVTIATQATVTEADQPINGQDVRQLTFSSSAWTYNTGVAGAQERIFVASLMQGWPGGTPIYQQAISLLVKVEATDTVDTLNRLPDIETISGNGTTTTVAFRKRHRLKTGDRIAVTNASIGGYNTTSAAVTATNGHTITYLSSGSGTPTGTQIYYRNLASMTATAGVVTVTCEFPHGFGGAGDNTNGDHVTETFTVWVINATDGTFNVSGVTATSTSFMSFTYPAAGASGTETTATWYRRDPANIELGWTMFGNREGRQICAPGRWYRIFCTMAINSNPYIALWSRTPGVAFTLKTTRLSLWSSAAADVNRDVPFFNQFLQEGLWIE